jgi:hypothetical protein
MLLIVGDQRRSCLTRHFRYQSLVFNGYLRRHLNNELAELDVLVQAIATDSFPVLFTTRWSNSASQRSSSHHLTKPFFN